VIISDRASKGSSLLLVIKTPMTSHRAAMDLHTPVLIPDSGRRPTLSLSSLIHSPPNKLLFHPIPLRIPLQTNSIESPSGYAFRINQLLGIGNHCRNIDTETELYQASYMSGEKCKLQPRTMTRTPRPNNKEEQTRAYITEKSDNSGNNYDKWTNSVFSSAAQWSRDRRDETSLEALTVLANVREKETIFSGVSCSYTACLRYTPRLVITPALACTALYRPTPHRQLPELRQHDVMQELRHNDVMEELRHHDVMESLVLNDQHGGLSQKSGDDDMKLEGIRQWRSR